MGSVARSRRPASRTSPLAGQKNARRRYFRPSAELLEKRCLLAATVWTDKLDYAPGETAAITASGFDVGSTVEFQVQHDASTPGIAGGQGHDPWSVTDGSAGDGDGAINGTILTNWYVNPDDSAGATFDLTASGVAEGQAVTAEWAFTDSAVTVVGTSTIFTLSQDGTADDQITFSHTVSSGSNRLLVVSVFMEGNEEADAVTFNGDPLTRATFVEQADSSGIWLLPTRAHSPCPLISARRTSRGVSLRRI
jgi:hypothetical protein